MIRVALLLLCLLTSAPGQGELKIPVPFAEWKQVRMAFGVVPFHKDGLLTLVVHNPNRTVCPLELNYDSNTKVEAGNTKSKIKDGEQYFVMYVEETKYALLMVRGEK